MRLSPPGIRRPGVRRFCIALGLGAAIAVLGGSRAAAQSCTYNDACRLPPFSLTNGCAESGGVYSGMQVGGGCGLFQERPVCYRQHPFPCQTSRPCEIFTCNGEGACAFRDFRAEGTPCGSPLDDACTAPDTCDGGTRCRPNHKIAGVECPTGYCTSGGLCALPRYFIARGTVTSSQQPGVSIGDAFSFQYAFDPSAPLNTEPFFPRYEALVSTQALAGVPGTFTWTGTPIGYIEIRDNSSSPDSYVVNMFGTDDLTCNLRLSGELPGGALPADPFELSATGHSSCEVPGFIQASIDRLEVDLCPRYSTHDNSDRDGNGIGDACECGDQNGDGRVDVLDIVAINLVLFGQAPASPLCDTNEDGACSVSDMIGVNNKIFGSPAYCARYPSR